MYSPTYKAVCYQCSYEGREQGTRCPVCKFPLILEPETTPPGGRRLEDILARGTIRDGGPPLPGVDAGKRKAQLMAEARRERLAAARARARSKAASRPVTARLPLPPPDDDGDVSLPVRRGWVAIKYGLLCASALVVGVAAAALQAGL